jgi:hypothetical protein
VGSAKWFRRQEIIGNGGQPLGRARASNLPTLRTPAGIASCSTGNREPVREPARPPLCGHELCIIQCKHFAAQTTRA